MRLLDDAYRTKLDAGTLWLEITFVSDKVLALCTLTASGQLELVSVDQIPQAYLIHCY